MMSILCSLALNYALRMGIRNQNIEEKTVECNLYKIHASITAFHYYFLKPQNG